jgi:predicted methyltransferase
MGKNGHIDPKWFGEPIYRYLLKSSESQYCYRFVSTKIKPFEAIEVMKAYIPTKGAYRLYCNGEQIHNYSARKNPAIKNKKTGDIWKNIVDFCIDNGYKRKQAQEVIRRKKDIYEYIYFNN